ncbi:hypothetical protein HG15A2_15430 [Adhaeretor mobilis]|uniref:Uncharacterized protein n=1 Tax=Adhaeretor mobilis TaxID=1930276 RepID=A0A517MTQ9_9BACT|nr:hypothetical protein HG15A2_15430 [Adhaeretor mobilis]
MVFLATECLISGYRIIPETASASSSCASKLAAVWADLLPAVSMTSRSNWLLLRCGGTSDRRTKRTVAMRPVNTPKSGSQSRAAFE